MTGDQKAHSAQQCAIKVFRTRPQQAKTTHKGFALLGDGLTCTFQQDDHSVTVDMPDAIGGYNLGPSPGFFGRAAIASCIGIKMAATRKNIKPDEVRVSVEQEFDSRGCSNSKVFQQDPQVR